MSTYHLRVVAYDHVYFDGNVQWINLPAMDGRYQVLANHEDCVIAVVAGDIEIVDENGKRYHAVCGNGFLEFDKSSNYGELLVVTVEKPEDIDVRRAREAKERAEERLKQKQSRREYEKSKADLSRAMARLKEASKYKK